MTEPDTAGSDPTLLKTRASGTARNTSSTAAMVHVQRLGGDFLIVMAVTNPDVHRTGSSMILVPTGRPGSTSCATWRRWRTRERIRDLRQPRRIYYRDVGCLWAT